MCLIVRAAAGLSLFGKSVMELCDYVTGQFLMPIGAIFTCAFVGWYLPKKLVRDEFTNADTLPATFFRLFLILVRYVAPTCIIIVFLHQFGLL